MGNKKILVTGGTGYIGSHTIVDLTENGYDAISIDNGSNSNKNILEKVSEIVGKKIKHYDEDLRNLSALKKIFKENQFDGVIHFAAFKAVGESVAKPIEYFQNNLSSLLNVLECCRDYNVGSFIFSSSCTVYGNAEKIPVDENTPLQEATSPYGRTKQIGEDMIKDIVAAENIQAIALRYFNPAGAHSSIKIGESPVNIAQNLVPIITETAIGKRKSFSVFGTDYNTRDGSCIRDYIHIMDLAHAHTLAITYLLDGKQNLKFDTYNLGIGDGVSVIEAIEAFEKVTGKKVNYTLGKRRPGDVIAIYADYTKARENLKWQPKYGIEEIMDSSWKWEQVR